MHLYDLPAILILTGLTLYTILGGADFGAGIWQLTTLLAPDRSQPGQERSRLIRQHAHHAIGPVWEANHVWLIFVITVTWTAYPAARHSASCSACSYAAGSIRLHPPPTALREFSKPAH